MDSSNDYDAILDQNPPQAPSGTPANEYDHLIDSDRPMQKEAMASAAYVAKDAIPDRHAQVIKLADQMSLPTSIVERNFDDLTKKQQIAGTDYDGIIDKTPEFASWLQKPDNAALAKDDHDALGNLESTVKEHTVLSQMYNALGQGLATVNTQIAKIPALAYDVAAVPQNLVASALGYDDHQVKAPEWLSNNPLAQKYDRDTKAFAEQAPALSESVVGHIKDGNYSKAGQALAVQMVAGAPQLAALVVGALTGVGEATATGVGITTAAGANSEAKEKPGVTPLQSTGDALLKGTIATEFGKLGTLGVLSSWESAIAKTAGKQVSKEVMKDFAKTLLYSVGRGTAQGGGMSLANDFSDYITGVNPDAMTGSLERAVNQGFVMGATEPFMAIPGLASGAHERMQQARQTEMDQNFYKSMGASAEATKLRKRLPEAQRDLIEKITRDTPVENLYISPQAAEVYFQKKGLNPVEVMGQLGVLPEYGKAKDAGTDIKIPMSKWVDKVVGTEHYQGLENDVKFSPEGLSVNELQAEHGRLKSEHEAAQAAKPEQETTAEQSAAKVGDTVSQQLEAAGVHPTASKIYESGFHSLGERMGVDPQDLFNQFKLKITGGDDAKPQPLQNDKERKTMNQPARAVTFPVKQSSEGIFSVAPGEGMNASAHMNKGAMEIDALYFHDKYMGVAQDMIRSLEKTALAANAFTMRATVTNEKLLKAYKAQGFEVESEKNGDTIMVKDLSKLRTYNQDQINKSGLSEQELAKHKALLDTIDTPEKAADLKGEERAKYHEALDALYGTQDERAKMMGFGRKTWYHGTSEEIQQFNREKLGASTNAKSAREGFFFAEDPSTASDYADLAREKGVVREDVADRLDQHQGKRYTEVDNAHSKWLSEQDRADNGPKKTLDKAIADWDKQKSDPSAWVESAMKREGFANVKDYIDSKIEKLKSRYTPDMLKKATPKEVKAARDAYFKEWEAFAQGEPELSRKLAPIYLERAKPEEAKAINAALKSAEDLHGSTGQNVLAVKLRGKPHIKDYQGQGYRDTTYAEEMSKAKEAGKDGVLFQNTEDPGDPNNRVTQNIAAVFDPNQIRSTNAAFDPRFSDSPLILAQQGDGDSPRGQIHIGDHGIDISILKDADASTFLHETGHFYLEVMKDLSAREDASPQIKDDMGKIREWLGAKDGEEISVEQHEQFARGFEAYLMEGKAPSEGLRKAFANFKVWLTNIYRKMRSLNVQLSPEIRGVYDRILATDNEIQQARTRQNYKPLFSEPAMYKLSPDEFAKYQSAIDAAKLAADDTLRAKVMKDITQTETAMYKEQETRVRGEIEDQANQTRVFKAKSLLQLDKLPDGSPRPEGSPKLKLDREGLVRAYGKEILEKLPRMYGREGAMDHNLVAEMLGYENGDHLVQELVNSPTKQDYVEQQTKARMEDMHPDLLSSGKMPDEAMNAIHNDQRAKVLRMELEFLARNNMPELKGMIKKVANRVPTDQEIRTNAVNTINTVNVRDLKPGQYKSAEARHAREAGEKLTKGDFDGAFESKRLELYNHELYQAVTDAKEEVDKAMKDFRKMARKSDEDLSKTRDTNLVAATRAVLAAFGIGTSEQPPEAYLDKLKRYDPENYAAAHALVEMATADGSGNFSDISYDKFVSMRDTVKGIWDLAKSSQQITIDGKKMAKQQILDGLNARISDLSPTGPRPGYEKAMTAWEKTKITLMSWKAAGRRVESWVTAMDGAHQGLFRTAIWNPITEAATKFRLAKHEMMREYLDTIVKPVEDTFNNRVVDAPEINYQFKNKSQLLGALLHTGNESNFSKLLRGRNWGTADEQGNLDSSRWDKMIDRMHKDGTLTKKDYDYVQGVWNLYEKTKVGAQKAHKDMYGYYFNEITAKKIQTPFGEYEGGYAPAIADPTLSEDAQIRADKEQIEKNNNSYMFPTTGRGFTKERVEAYAAPLAIDLEYVPMQIDKVLRFTHIEPSVKEVGRLINDKSFRQTLSGLDPVVASEMLTPWLQRAAQQQTSTPSQGKAWKGFDYVMRKARGNTGMNAMVGNLVNVLHQTTGLPIILTRVEASHFRDAMWGYLKDAKGTTEMMHEKSDYMRSKEANIAEIQSDINDIIMNPSKYDKATNFIKQNGFILQRLTAGMVENVAWQSAYRQSTEKGMTEKESVRFADSVVRETQHSSNPEEISRFGTGSPFMRAFTMYFDYYNMKANLLGTEAGNIYREMGMIKGFPQLSYLYATGFMLPAVMAAGFYHLASGRLDENDDHKYMDDVLKIFFGGQLSDGLALVPVVGPIANNFINRFNDNPMDDRLSVSPVFKNLERILGTPKEAYDVFKHPNHKRSGAIHDSMSLLGMFTGLPIEPLSRPLGYLSDVQQGFAKPTGPIDFTRGLMTGQSGAAHKK